MLLNHQFVEPRYQKSRLEDPIVGVSFTGLFDFFVNAFGVEWLRWWEEGRPDTMQGLEFKEKEQAYLNRWRDIVHQTVWDYCDRHGLNRPNRCTTVTTGRHQVPANRGQPRLASSQGPAVYSPDYLPQE